MVAGGLLDPDQLLEICYLFNNLCVITPTRDRLIYSDPENHAAVVKKIIIKKLQNIKTKVIKMIRKYTPRQLLVFVVCKGLVPFLRLIL